MLEASRRINQLIEMRRAGGKAPPATAEPFTRQFLRIFDGVTEVPRDQVQNALRGTGIAPSDFEARGWCKEDQKVYRLTPPLGVARAWQRKHRRGMTSDYDQAMFLIGACFDNSGINATDTLTNDNFKPHPALESLLEWFATRGATSEIRNAASRAHTILRSWRAKHETQAAADGLFGPGRPMMIQVPSSRHPIGSRLRRVGGAAGVGRVSLAGGCLGSRGGRVAGCDGSRRCSLQGTEGGGSWSIRGSSEPSAGLAGRASRTSAAPRLRENPRRASVPPRGSRRLSRLVVRSETRSAWPRGRFYLWTVTHVDVQARRRVRSAHRARSGRRTKRRRRSSCGSHRAAHA